MAKLDLNRGAMPRQDPNAMADEFARWGDYQQALQRGEKPDEAKRRLGL